MVANLFGAGGAGSSSSSPAFTTQAALTRAALPADFATNGWTTSSTPPLPQGKNLVFWIDSPGSFIFTDASGAVNWPNVTGTRLESIGPIVSISKDCTAVFSSGCWS